MKKTQSWKGKFIKDKSQTSFEVLIQTKKHTESIIATLGLTFYFEKNNVM